MPSRSHLFAALAGTITLLGTGAGANPLSEQAWQNRPLVVSAPSGQSAELARQTALLEPHLDALRERDMVVVAIIGQTVRSLVGGPVTANAKTLRRHLRLDADAFQVVLVGKDTGVKLRSDEPVSASDLFSLIDAMPMRRQEMRQRQ
ncbi:MAG: DUF4174 domain-containing protein [Pseudomonadota bacterium]